ASHIRAKVKRNSRVSSFSSGADDISLAQIKSPPEAGKANAELIGSGAAHLGCGKSSVSIKSGSTSRTKLIRIESK
ncbi:MAG: DUF167 domain-containing protein, partial [Burkholderiales bacterium]